APCRTVWASSIVSTVALRNTIGRPDVRSAAVRAAPGLAPAWSGLGAAVMGNLHCAGIPGLQTACGPTPCCPVVAPEPFRRDCAAGTVLPELCCQNPVCSIQCAGRGHLSVLLRTYVRRPAIHGLTGTLADPVAGVK